MRYFAFERRFVETRGCLLPMSAIRKQGAPLDFQKVLVENIQKIKNGLCLSPPPFRQSLFLEQKNRTRYAPHQSTTLTASPPRGSREAADNFCLIVREHDKARGSLGTRQIIFASLCASTMRQGEALGQGIKKNKSSCGKMPQDEFAVLLYAV